MKATCIIASYNQGDTLRRAIESVLMQQTDFDYQIVIVDDASCDDSPDIIWEYAEDNDNIDPLLLSENGGIMNTYRIAFGMAHGDYLFWCESSDYWTDPHKMQKQVSFMEANKDVGVCTHRVMTEICGDMIDRSLPSAEANARISFDSLLRGNAYLYAQSYCVRRDTFKKWIDFDMFSRRFAVWDYPMVLELVRRTRFHQLPDYCGVFVIDGESFTHTFSRQKRLRLILIYNRIRLYFILKYGCKPSILAYVIYKFAWDITSIIFRRWCRLYLILKK